eukprot:Tamp_25938.p2 GENE.Tamp_25938~~Tamp_25938.p2  ORF type:complete len:115 (-),score=30.73 Tamp_25938:505-849(-)
MHVLTPWQFNDLVHLHHFNQLLTKCDPGLTVNGNARGIGVTCYSHNGKDLYCNKPPAGKCFTTGGWCPPDFGGDDEILPDEGITAFCGITPLTFSGSSFSSAAAEPAAEETASA